MLRGKKLVKKNPKDNFSKIPNEVLKAEKLSAVDKLILIYLHTYPQNWTLAYSRLAVDFSIDKSNLIKRWKHLIKEGYITVTNTEYIVNYDRLELPMSGSLVPPMSGSLVPPTQVVSHYHHGSLTPPTDKDYIKINNKKYKIKTNKNKTVFIEEFNKFKKEIEIRKFSFPKTELEKVDNIILKLLSNNSTSNLNTLINEFEIKLIDNKISYTN